VANRIEVPKNTVWDEREMYAAETCKALMKDKAEEPIHARIRYRNISDFIKCIYYKKVPNGYLLAVERTSAWTDINLNWQVSKNEIEEMPNDMTTLCGIKRNFLYGISIAIYDEEKLLVSSNNAYTDLIWDVLK
jgi:hypothetical protein